MGPHSGQPILVRGRRIEEARAALVLLHGRNAGPENIMELAHALDHPDYAYLAPAAAGRTWYPHSFLSPTDQNEPSLSSALSVVARLMSDLEDMGLPRTRVILLGFSQGACLGLTAGAKLLGDWHSALEARDSAPGARRLPDLSATRRLGILTLGGIIGFSGGLIGPPGTQWDFEGDAAGMPVLLGCSDVDPHIPRNRVEETAREFDRLGARVTLRIFPGMGHLVNEVEIELARETMREVVERSG